MMRFIDSTLGRWTRHFFFIVVRSYYSLFYNVSCSGKHLLQDHPGALILATHVSRHDGPIIAAILYTTTRVRTVVHYNEYYNWLQWFPMFVISAIPVSSPREWPKEKRAERKAFSLGVVSKVLHRGNAVLLFPAGKTRRQPEEIVEPHYSGAFDVVQSNPDIPIMLVRIDGLGKFQTARHDSFYTFIGRKKGRRHVSIDIKRVDDLDTSRDLAAFNADLEARFNTPIRSTW
ncbi:1-acyl-sn-glycerol-3-phosphate acyltransferase [uncultured Tateyamaria sp.]|uniref:lysophospholipid acyltransferase family protein n=1 Tax=Tateyamaria sp. 1078 TaxID=3417464 RepID=UPI002637B9BE|nr:1-acyl-sn-glycerol-3-phosphate acyltransferase [uncultured Tateyamaria sp.]